MFIKHLLCDQGCVQEKKINYIVVPLRNLQMNLENTVHVHKTARTSTKKFLLSVKLCEIDSQGYKIVREKNIRQKWSCQEVHLFIHGLIYATNNF